MTISSTAKDRKVKMKTFKEIQKEIVECWNPEYDDMTLRELKIACYTSQKIMEMIENGTEVERWNLSKITLAADYLSSVYTFMKTNEREDPDMSSVDYEYPGDYDF
jgi:CO dehydrogenase/acetyl-CoA synthase alpha subunit